MLRCSGLLCFAFLASGMAAAAQPEAAGPRVNDQAGLFSKSAVEQATRKLQDIQRRFNVDIVIDTVASVPNDMKAQFDANPAIFFRDWAVIRGDDEGAKGIYVLICKEPLYLQIELHPSVSGKAFKNYQRDTLVKKMLAANAGPDAALLEMVNRIASTVEINLKEPEGGTAPPAEEVPGKPSFDWSQWWASVSGWLCLAAGVAFLLWLTLAVFRPLFGSGGYGGLPDGGTGGPTAAGSGAAGSGPVYGGGGFFSSLLGGIFGAAAGNWMYDSFVRGGNRGSPQSDAAAPFGGGSSGPDAASPDQTGGGAFGGDTDDTNGDFGGDDSLADHGGFDDDSGGDFGGGGGFDDNGDFGGGSDLGDGGS